MVLLGLVVAGCASTTLPTGIGWQVTRAGLGEANVLRARMADDHHVELTLGVNAGCGGGGFEPSLAGFEARGDALVAKIARTPVPSPGGCAITQGYEAVVVIDTRSISDTSRRFVLGGDACFPEDEVCNDLSAPMPFVVPPS